MATLGGINVTGYLKISVWVYDQVCLGRRVLIRYATQLSYNVGTISTDA